MKQNLLQLQLHWTFPSMPILTETWLAPKLRESAFPSLSILYTPGPRERVRLLLTSNPTPVTHSSHFSFYPSQTQVLLKDSNPPFLFLLSPCHSQLLKSSHSPSFSKGLALRPSSSLHSWFYPFLASNTWSFCSVTSIAPGILSSTLLQPLTHRFLSQNIYHQ